MFRVGADSVAEYFRFDPSRRGELQKLDAVIRRAAPNLKRFFHPGTPKGQPGMRLKMIGYGRFHYTGKTGRTIEWPVIGVALQKNYISVYVSLTRNGRPLVAQYAARLSALKVSRYTFTFENFGALNAKAVQLLFRDVGALVLGDPQNPVRCKEGS